MCLGIPGEIVAVREGGAPESPRLAVVRFGGAEREVCLDLVPEARVGDFVIVHVGVAISILAREEADAVFGYLEEIQALSELEAEAGAPGEPPEAP